MNEQEQIEKLSKMVSNSKFMGDSNLQIAEMALTMALHWNQDTQEAAPEMYAALCMTIHKIPLTPNVHGGDYMFSLTQDEVNKIRDSLAKARGES